MKAHFYPSNLAFEVSGRWPASAPPLPRLAVLERFISVAYQASLMHEEGRPVRCRVVLSLAPAGPTLPDASPPQELVLAVPRSYEEQEIRRLSPALQSPYTVLAVEPTPEDTLLIWGLLRCQHPEKHSLPLTTVHAPQSLQLDMRGPGNLVFYAGSTRLLTLQHGFIDGHGFLDFPGAWARGRFTESFQAVQHQLEGKGIRTTSELPMLLVPLAHMVLRRIVARTRAGGHGGMLALVPTATVARYVGSTATLRPKYQVRSPHETHHYFDLVMAIVGRLAESGEVSWSHYQQGGDACLGDLTRAVGAYADLLADLMAVDGALVLTKELAVVGFGIEVYAPELTLTEVYRALDAEGIHLQAEAADGGGTRHRAAYRLCVAEPDSLALVISQDGGVRFVHSQAGKVIFWEQLTL